MPWVKLYTELLDDPKVNRLPLAARWLFIQLLLIAGECDLDGRFINGTQAMTLEDIAWRLREDKDTITGSWLQLAQAGLVSYDNDLNAHFITNFSKRQGRSQFEKQQQWRESKRRSRSESNAAPTVVQSVQSPEQSRPLGVQQDSAGSPHPREDKRRVDKSREEELSATETVRLAVDVPVTATQAASAAPTSPPRTRDLLFDAVAELCVMDARLNGSRIAKTSNALRRIDATVEQIGTFKVWWDADDWRRAHTPIPTPEQITSNWLKAIQGVLPDGVNGNGLALNPRVGGGQTARQALVLPGRPTDNPNVRTARNGVQVWVGE